MHAVMDGRSVRGRQHAGQQRAGRQRAGAPYDVVLTTEGRRLLERKADELRTQTLPAQWQAVIDDRADEQARIAYEDKLAELRRLESVLAQSAPVRRQPRSARQVSLGDRVTVRFLKDAAADEGAGEAEDFLLVHPFEAPLDMLRISVTSPLGRAVLAHEVGDVVEFDSPTGRRAVRLLAHTPGG